jgi:hypothetical protein
LIVLGTIGTVPWLVRDGGWLALAVCAAWSFGTAVALLLAAKFAKPSPKKQAIFALLIIASFFLIPIVPGAMCAILYGPEAGGGACYLGFFCGWGPMFVVGFFENRRLQREAIETERFRARFEDGPIGNWRGVRLDLQGGEQGCQIVFNADGSGHYRLWDAREAEDGAGSIQFRWRPEGEYLIELTLLGDEASRRLKYALAFYGDGATKLLLSVAGSELPDESSPWQIGSEEFDRVHWPRYLAFEYLGEPASPAFTEFPESD